MAEESKAETVTRSIFMMIFIILAVVGNILVCVAIRKNKRLKTMTNYYVFNLAVADFLYGVTGMPLILTTAIAGKWILGDALCQVSGTLTTLFVLVSIWTMCLIGINRYFAVGRSTSYRSIYKKRRVLFSIGSVWVIAGAVSVAPQIGWSSIRHGDNFCTVNGKDDISYSIFVILVAYLAPLLALSVLYTKIFFVLRNHEKTMVGMKSGSKVVHSEHEGDSMDYSSTFKMESGKASSLPRDVHFDQSTLRNVQSHSHNNAALAQKVPSINGDTVTHGGEINSNMDFSANFAPETPERGTECIHEKPRNTEESCDDEDKNGYLDVSKSPTTAVGETSRTASGSGIRLIMDGQSGTPTVTYQIEAENQDTPPIRKTRTLSSIANALKLRRPRTSKKLKKFKFEAKITKMLFVVVAVFFICWTPLVVGTILYAFNVSTKNFNLMNFGFLIASMNSICNPIIYAFMNQLFRKAFKDLFTTCHLRNDESQEKSHTNM